MRKIRRFLMSILTILTLVGVVPVTTYAYSYGNPNEDAIATTYIDMLAALSKEPLDYQTTQIKFDSIKQEMLKEFGQDQMDRIQKGITDKEKEVILYEMKVVLVRNIERRFTNLRENFEDYPQAKMLLAKAFATYEALSSELAKEDPDLDQQIRNAFDQSLTALGNPGLFNVGKIEPNRKQLDENTAFILQQVKDFFKTEAGYQGHTKGTGQTKVETEGGTSQWGNWIPLIVISVVLLGAILFFIRGKRK